MPGKGELAGRIKTLRKKAGLNQDELADLIDVSIMTVRRWEWGARSPRMEEVKRIAAALHVTEAELLNGPSSTEWRIEAVFKKEEDWEMNKSIDMCAGGPNMFLAEVGTEKIALNLVGAPQSEEELDGLWAKLKPQIMNMLKLRDGLNAGLAAATA